MDHYYKKYNMVRLGNNMRNPSLHLFRGVKHVVIVACNYPLSVYMHEF